MGKSLKGLAKHPFPAGSPKGRLKRGQGGTSVLHLSFQLHLLSVLSSADHPTGAVPSHRSEPSPKKGTQGGEMLLQVELTFLRFKVLSFWVLRFCVLRFCGLGFWSFKFSILSFKFLSFQFFEL